jgi:ribokinase
MYDVITVGSATVDTFAHTETESVIYQNGRLCYPGGAKILLSKLIFTTGGGGTNTAVAFSRLGLKTAFIGKMGKYTNSKRVIWDLKRNKVDTSLVCRGTGRTGYSIILDPKGHDRTILAFKGSNNDLMPNEVKFSKLKTKWFYFSSMLEKSFKTQVKIAQYAERKKIKIAFNPSMYLAIKGKKYLAPIISRTEVIIMNKEEAELITKKKKIAEMAKELHKQGPKIIAITNGKEGTYVYDGQILRFIKAHKIKPIETTGAGDAFASGFVAGIIKGKITEEAMLMGTANAESVIMKYGAKEGLLNYNEMMKRIKNKPSKIIEREI